MTILHSPLNKMVILRTVHCKVLYETLKLFFYGIAAITLFCNLYEGIHTSFFIYGEMYNMGILKAPKIQSICLQPMPSSWV